MQFNRWGLTSWILSATTAAALVACGGGTPNFGSVVVFGDSLSDVGAYTPVTSATGDGKPPFIGGKFTTNSATGTVWVENVANALGVKITANEVGYANQSVKCPSNNATCTGYAQGGSRVTDPNGIGHDSGALTVPMKTQITNHLARFSGYKGNELVFVYGGNNDAFYQFGVFGAIARKAADDAAAGSITALEAKATTDAALAAGAAEMQKAASELVGYVKNDILAKGAAFVVVSNLPDSTLTPFGDTLSMDAKAVLKGFVNAFNVTLAAGLLGSNVKLLDSNALYKDAYNNPSKYGIVNNKDPACDATKISAITGGVVNDGSSLFCNATTGAPYNGIRAGADVNTWQFADGVHPTTGGHKVISDKTLEALRSYGWY